MTTLHSIDHFVVLMLENRSFDNLLGALYPKSPAFDGVDGTQTNVGRDGRVWRLTPTGDEDNIANLSVPAPDGGELWSDMNLQIFGSGQVGAVGDHNCPKKGAVANMSGFVESFTDMNGEPPRGDYDPQKIMSYYQPEKHVPALATLAKQFAVCDCWFASAPCQTWPNRFFLHTGTAAGYENNAYKKIFEFTMPTIFGAFDAAGQRDGWAIYHHDIPQTLALAQLRMRSDNFHMFDTFVKHAGEGTLPSYSFIEPRYYADAGLFPPRIRMPNDQHPPHIVTFGDELVASVYNALRSNEKAWKKTMLVVIYDEHGACYDHVPPGAAAAPGNGSCDNPAPVFDFDRYGVRVPAVVASPYIAEGTVLRPSDDYPHDGATPFDHTSVIATLRKRFGLGAPLTARDAAAPTLERVLNLASPENLGPKTVTPSSYDPGIAYKIGALLERWNDLQLSLHDLARKLPPDGHGRAQDSIDRHVTTADPHEDDGVYNEPTRMLARARRRASQALRLRK